MSFCRTIRKTLLATVIITSCLASLAGAAGAATARMALTYDYFGDAENAGKFYLPIPPNTSCQQILSFHSNWSGHVMSNALVPAQRWLAGTTPRTGPLHWRVRIVGLFSQEPMGENSGLTPEFFTGTSDALDWESTGFQAWLDRHDLRRGSSDGSAAFARRVANFLVAHGDYTYPPAGGWTASGAARRLRTDCGGFSLVFVAACRANHIPARMLVGQWLKTGSEGGRVIGRQAHVMAEFYDPAAGWEPVDVYAGLTCGSGRNDYFGRQPGYFFTWHFDTDYRFDVPAGADGHVQWIQNPAPWFGGESGESGSHHWTIEPGG